MAQEPKVTVALPFEGHVAPAALIGFAGLLYRMVRAGLLASVTCSEGGVIDGVRNQIVAAALAAETGMTHLLWVDPSLVVPADAAETLLAHGRPAVAGVCARRLDGGWDSGYEIEPLRRLD